MPQTSWAAGQRITAGGLNDLIPPSIQLVQPSTSIPVGANTYTPVPFASVAQTNTPSMWSAGQPTRLVAPYAGTFLLHGFIGWPGTLGTADARGEFRTNGSATPIATAKCGTQRGSTGNMASTLSGVVIFTAAAQYVELYLNHAAAGAVAISATLGMTRVSFATS
ncbi:hypothetical protein [Streptomyces sp. NPDC053541]|uniref:hypothetical protein n=1 Tax=Streptomyces sp. NPDC053541 TaxID=3365709 RepID=UPI0037D7F91F